MQPIEVKVDDDWWSKQGAAAAVAAAREKRTALTVSTERVRLSAMKYERTSRSTQRPARGSKLLLLTVE